MLNIIANARLNKKIMEKYEEKTNWLIVLIDYIKNKIILR